MDTVIPPTIDVYLTPADLRAAMEADVRIGLTSLPKQLPPVYFYDDRGSRLFDEITRLPEYYPTRAERAILEARAADMPVSALACDIDWFKSINDRFGHDAGDVVIRSLGDKLRTCFEPLEALVCRHGGEEFVVLLPGLSGAYAMKWAERLRATCAAETPTPGGLPVAFSVSVGVAEMSPSGACLRDLLRSADIALYEAKSKGRNRVERHAPTPMRRAASA